jgi:hypothetical protein
MQLDSVFVREAARTDGHSSPVGVQSTRETKKENASSCRTDVDKHRSGRPNASSTYDSVQMRL